jgi:hypothetical protein
MENRPARSNTPRERASTVPKAGESACAQPEAGSQELADHRVLEIERDALAFVGHPGLPACQVVGLAVGSVSCDCGAAEERTIFVGDCGDDDAGPERRASAT